MPDLLAVNLAPKHETITLFKEGTTYYARRYNGVIFSSSDTAETVIQAALDNFGTIYFSNNQTTSVNGVDWNLSAGFTGLTIKKYVQIIAEYGTFINVPNGYSGNCFLYTGDGVTGGPSETSSMRGLSFTEQGTPSKLWTAIKIQADTSSQDSMINTVISDLNIYNPGVGIELEVQNSRWINGNTFRDITVYDPIIGYLFDKQSGSIANNLFMRCQVEANNDSACTHGIKDIAGDRNVFIDCNMWDIHQTRITANLTSTARSTLFLGGNIVTQEAGTTGAFIDLGQGTMVIAPSTGGGKTTSFETTADVAKTGSYCGQDEPALSSTGILDDIVSNVVVGTGGGFTTTDSTGIYRTYTTGATINSLIGLYTNIVFTRRILNPYFKTALYLESNANLRIFAGFAASASAPAASADPLSALEGAGLWFDSAVSANWKFMHNDSSGASTVDDLSIAAATSTLYPVEIMGLNDSTFRMIFNGVHTDVTSNIPASTTNLAVRVYIQNTTGADRRVRQYYLTVRTDK